MSWMHFVCATLFCWVGIFAVARLVIDLRRAMRAYGLIR